MQQSRRVVNLFYSYSHRDSDYRSSMEKALALLKREGLLEDWSDQSILAGRSISTSIQSRMNDSDIIAFLISPEFIDSEECMKEWDLGKRLMYENENLFRVPIILRDCAWVDLLDKDDVKVLPLDGVPVSNFENQDAAWQQVYEGIKAIVEELTVVKQLAGPIHMEKSSARIELRWWEYDSKEHLMCKEFPIDGGKVHVKVYDYYVYRRHDKLRVAPLDDSRVRIDWHSSGQIGDIEYLCGTEVEEDATVRETTRHRNRVGMIFPLRPGQDELEFSVHLYNDLRKGFRHVSIKTFDKVLTDELEIKVDYSALPDARFFQEEPRAIFRHEGQEPGVPLDVKQEDEVWVASYRPPDSSPIDPDSTIQLSWEQQEG